MAKAKKKHGFGPYAYTSLSSYSRARPDDLEEYTDRVTDKVVPEIQKELQKKATGAHRARTYKVF